MSLKRPAGQADHPGMRPSVLPTARDERGYTLVELMVAALVLVIGILGAFALLDGANRTTVTNNARMGATNLAREILEVSRSLDYDTLDPAQLLPSLQAKASLGGTGTPWKISRRGIEYTITTDVCVFDDPKDNIATDAPANVCTPQAAVGTGPAETQPDDFRRVKVSLTWNTGRGDISISQTSLINNPSGGLGPRIKVFTAPPDDVNQLTSGTVATFPTETTPAGAVRWNSDGSPSGSGDSTAGNTLWTTTWQLGAPADPLSSSPQYDPATTVLDGTYTVTAQAFDDRGIAGDARAAILPLNRSFPLTVTGFEAGRNSYQGVVDFQWEQNPERDIIGYEVYDAGPDSTLGNGNDTLVCSTASVSVTSCTDTSPPSSAVTYFVVALDRTDITKGTSAPRRSPTAKMVSVPSAAVAAPTAPVLLPVVLDAETGNPQLSWTHLNLAGVRFFRIYRDNCCNVSDRYDSTPTNGTSWVDPNPNGAAHRYWVTAVGPVGPPAGLNESNPSNRAESLAP